MKAIFILFAMRPFTLFFLSAAGGVSALPHSFKHLAHHNSRLTSISKRDAPGTHLVGSPITPQQDNSPVEMISKAKSLLDEILSDLHMTDLGAGLHPGARKGNSVQAHSSGGGNTVAIANSGSGGPGSSTGSGSSISPAGSPATRVKSVGAFGSGLPFSDEHVNTGSGAAPSSTASGSPSFVGSGLNSGASANSMSSGLPTSGSTGNTASQYAGDKSCNNGFGTASNNGTNYIGCDVCGNGGCKSEEQYCCFVKQNGQNDPVCQKYAASTTTASCSSLGGNSGGGSNANTGNNAVTGNTVTNGGITTGGGTTGGGNTGGGGAGGINNYGGSAVSTSSSSTPSDITSNPQKSGSNSGNINVAGPNRGGSSTGNTVNTQSGNTQTKGNANNGGKTDYVGSDTKGSDTTGSDPCGNGGCGAGGSDNPQLNIVNNMRAKWDPSLPPYKWSETLAASSRACINASPNSMHHMMGPGSNGQVLAQTNSLEASMKMWMCEIPKAPGLCTETTKGIGDDPTGHAELLQRKDFTHVGCANSPSIFGCDLGMA